jgi:uncharacterized protein (DUF1501 family)
LTGERFFASLPAAWEKDVSPGHAKSYGHYARFSANLRKGIRMITLLDRPHSFCDGVSRRSFLKIGALGFCGLTLADLFRAEAAEGVRSSNKALINIFLAGGPSHQDTFDLKPDAPSEYRGEFYPIGTNVPGIQICELLPKLAGMADKYALLRSVVGAADEHSSNQTQSGYAEREFRTGGGFPALGSVVAKLQGSDQDSAPPFMSFMSRVNPGFLGPAYAPFQPSDGRGRQDLMLGGAMTVERLRGRTRLLASLDRLRRDMDRSGAMEALDAFTQRAVNVVVSSKLAEALDLDQVDQATKDRYYGAHDGRRNESKHLLQARRLIEAGVRCVSLQWGGWDTHSNNFESLRTMMPALDMALSALIQDLHDRSLDRDVTVVVWGEFGRTPRVNNNAGRDHWPRVMSALMAGGGLRTGQVIGATDRHAGEAYERPVHVREIMATLYRNLGIDAKATTLPDTAGRPQYLVDGRDPIRELI